MLWVRPPPELLDICPHGAAWSARLSVKQEIAGSNPAGDACGNGTVRKPVKRPSSNLGDLSVGSTPTRATETFASAGHWRAQVAVTHPPSGIAGSTPARRTDTARSSIGSGRQPLTLEGRVRFPHGSLDHFDQVVEWQARDAQNVVPSTAWEFDSPLGH